MLKSFVSRNPFRQLTLRKFSAPPQVAAKMQPKGFIARFDALPKYQVIYLFFFLLVSFNF
jgi:hypothetical protein